MGSLVLLVMEEYFVVYLVFILSLVLSIFVFTCSQARQARTRPGQGLATEDLHSSPETVRRIIEELDLRYERIPEEYKDQNSCDNIRFTSSSVSSSGYSSRSSVCRDRSDS